MVIGLCKWLRRGSCRDSGSRSRRTSCRAHQRHVRTAASSGLYRTCLMLSTINAFHYTHVTPTDPALRCAMSQRYTAHCIPLHYSSSQCNLAESVGITQRPHSICSCWPLNRIRLADAACGCQGAGDELQGIKRGVINPHSQLQP